MNARRARILSAMALGLGVLIPLSIVPAAAATCALSAPATVKVGTALAIVGSGFPASSSIDVSLGLEGATPDEFTVQSDGSGAFQISLTPEPADAGKTTVVATAGTTCSARTDFTVTGATATPTRTPEATTPPTGSGAGSTSNPPRSDAATASVGRTTDMPSIGWALALLMILIGVSGVIATRRSGGR